MSSCLHSSRAEISPTLTPQRPRYSKTLTVAERNEAIPNKWLSLGIILVGPFLGVVDFFIANIGAATIQDSLHTGYGQLELIIAGYGLAYAVCLVTGGRLGDIYGRKKTFILGMAGFTLTSALCGYASSGSMLILCRLIQGCTAALMFPQALSFIQVNFSGDAKRMAFSAFGAMIGFGSILGQIAGGFLIQANLFNLGWRPIFLINLPIGIATICAALFFLQEHKVKHAARLDPIGVLLLTLALFLFSVPFMEGANGGWPSWAGISLAASLPVFWLFYQFERRLSEKGGTPLVEPRLFRDRGFVTGIVVTWIYFAGHTSMLLVLCLFLQRSLDLDPLHAGLALAPFSFGFLVGSTFSGKLNGALGRNSLHLGALILAVSLLALMSQAASSQGSETWLFALTCFCYGIGRGTVTAPLYNTVLSGVSPKDAGAASGIASTAQQIANSVGIAMIGLLVFSTLPKHPTTVDFAHAFVLSSFINLIMLAIASALLFLVPKSRGRDTAPDDLVGAEA
ncbi:MAG: MFS transporter [Verrucomicrobia bacterium]|nr:MFS transporter [Verrucomicrobiota bacterium]